MNITLITSFKGDSENIRLMEEAEKLGSKLTIIDPATLSVKIQNNKLDYPEITATNPQLIIFRGVLHAIKKAVTLIDYYHQRGTRVFDNNLSQMQYSINKISDLSKLALKNVPLPNTRLNPFYENFPHLATEIGYPVIIKPINTGKGLGIVKIDNEKQLIQFIKEKESLNFPARNLLIQKFIPYTHDLRILAIGEQTFCMERASETGDFRANYSLGGSVKIFNPSEKTRQTAIDALRSINTSVAGVDILITEDNREYVLEVNHSPGFEGMEKATGQNIAKIFLEHAISRAR